MRGSLPISNFEWLKVKSNTVHNILEMQNDSDTGYFLEVDLVYPKELHDSHNDYPFCCEHMSVNTSKQKKLVLTLKDKENYVLHYHTLKLAVEHGLELKTVHKILQFKQTPWLKPFIDLNTVKRTESKNSFEKNLYKLMSNAIYGKCVENLRNRVDIKLVNHWRGRYGAKSLISKPNFKRRTIFNENLVAIEMERTNITINKPIMVGIAILEISKTLMYEFHYDFMHKKYHPDQCKLMYTDTDSFVYSLQKHNIYSVMKKNPEQFDTSDFAVDNIFGIKQQNKKIPGLMKDENNGHVISEFVGLRAKMYSIKIKQEDMKFKVMKRAKGVKKNVLSKKITFEDFKKCIFDNTIVSNTQATIKSHLHRVYSIQQAKKMLDANDDKRYILQNNINTLAWGHYKIPENVNNQANVNN